MLLREYQLKDLLPTREWRPTHVQLRQYAEASGDFNPIHLDEDAARAAGLDGVIAHGMLTMAQMGALLSDWIGERGFLQEFEVRFEQMVRPGETVLCSGAVKERKADGLVCTLLATNGQGKRVLSGTAVITFNG